MVYLIVLKVTVFQKAVNSNIFMCKVWLKRKPECEADHSDVSCVKVKLHLHSQFAFAA
jgi:hypothetical protein